MNERVSRKATKPGILLALCFGVVAAVCGEAGAGLSFYVEPNGWPNAGHRDAAVAAAQSTVNRYNAYGDFGNHSVYVYYNAGIPTAQANYLGSIGFGRTYPNERVMMHEMAHYLGSGTYGTPWDGARGEALVDQFDGLEATLNGDGAHFWPYGLNYDSEGSEINKQRQVALMYAQRADMGIGSTSNPWSVSAVSLTASDALGESGFNYASTWSDNRFAHPGAAYSTSNFLLRTPASSNSFTFVGDSLRVNNTNGASGGLLYKGTGSGGVTTFKNLIVDGGYVRHASGSGDVFRLAGKVTLGASATIDAAQGPITVTANIGGSGSLTKTGSHVLTLAGGNTYAGSTTISAGTLRLVATAPVANYTFDGVIGGTVVNQGTGGSGMNGTLANGAFVVGGGRFGSAVSLANGASVNINNPIVDLGPNTSWTVSAWVKTSTAGGSILTKGDGSGWGYGNTIFYLGDGTAGGSGGIPSGVRYAGGFFQGSTGAAAVNNNAWRQVTYVNEGGTFGIYVDGVAQPLSAGNGGFSVADVGSVVRLGVSTNTVAGDGTLNFNGLLDGVQFYSQALSGAQVAALYQGLSVGPLPATTAVTIAGGATLDVNGVTQQVASLSGPAGSAVTLGGGQLIVNSATSTQFAGVISGAGGSLAKSGTGALVLFGSNTYTGPTTVTGGTLRVIGPLAGSSKVTVGGAGTFEAAGGAQGLKAVAVGAGGTLRILASGAGSPARQLTIGNGTHTFADEATSALSVSGGRVDVTNNALVVRFAAGSDGAAAAAIRGQIASGRNGAAADWQGAGITSDAAMADPGNRAVGYALSSELLGPSGGSFMGGSVDGASVLVRMTVVGDATLDGVVDFGDLVRLAQNYNRTAVDVDWFDGDFDYDGGVDFADLVGLAQHYNGSLPAGGVPGAAADFGGDLAAAFAAVPEPGGVALGAVALAGVLWGRRRGARTRNEFSEDRKG